MSTPIVPINPNANANANLNVRVTHVSEGNPTNEAFLFFHHPKELARESACGCSLRTGVQIIAVIFLASTLTNLTAALRGGSLLSLVISGLTFSLYLVAGICLLSSTFSYNYQHANTATVIYSVIFLVNLVDNIIIAILIFLGVYAPFNTPDNISSGLVFSLAAAIVLGIHLYFVWIIFSYTVHLKNKRIALINGDVYKGYNEYEPVPTTTLRPTPANVV